MGADSEVDSPILLFDGYCNLCNGLVNFLIDQDSEEIIKFASIQSDFGKTYLIDHDYDPEDPTTLIVILGDTYYTKSEAVFLLAQYLNSPLRFIRLFRFLPLKITNIIYDLVAKNRYRLFGRRDTCRMPTPELISRFIDS